MGDAGRMMSFLGARLVERPTVLSAQLLRDTPRYFPNLEPCSVVGSSARITAELSKALHWPSTVSQDLVLMKPGRDARALRAVWTLPGRCRRHWKPDSETPNQKPFIYLPKVAHASRLHILTDVVYPRHPSMGSRGRASGRAQTRECGDDEPRTAVDRLQPSAREAALMTYCEDARASRNL